VRLIVGADPADAARLAADEVARACVAAVTARARALVAFSGGETPWLMLQSLRERELPWRSIHVTQVDERVAPAGDARRNLTRLVDLLIRGGPLPEGNLWPMPVEDEPLDAAAASFQARLEAEFGRPVGFDLVQLGLGTDGHTASLVPGDPVLRVDDRDVAVSRLYQGTLRMTLTFPALSRARERMWLVTGASKAARLQELLAGGGAVPSVRVSREHATVIADAAAAPCPGLRPTSPA
jgi:6-phosphogluconolactonase